jgi:hypothetical protein
MLYPIELWVQSSNIVAFLQIPIRVLRLAALAREIGTLKITSARKPRSWVILAIELMGATEFSIVD